MFGISPWAIVGGAGAGVVILVSAYFAGDNAGFNKAESRALKAEAVAHVLAERVAAAQQGTTDLSAQLGAERSANIQSIAAANRPEVRTYYAQSPVAVRACLAPDRVRSIADADAAATAAASAASRIVPPLPDPASQVR